MSRCSYFAFLGIVILATGSTTFQRRPERWDRPMVRHSGHEADAFPRLVCQPDRDQRGILLLVGLSRPLAAAGITGSMAMAWWQGHNPDRAAAPSPDCGQRRRATPPQGSDVIDTPELRYEDTVERQRDWLRIPIFTERSYPDVTIQQRKQSAAPRTNGWVPRTPSLGDRAGSRGRVRRRSVHEIRRDARSRRSRHCDSFCTGSRDLS